MNWLESLGLASIPLKLQVSLFLHHQLGSDLRRRELLLHPSASRIRSLVPSPPRSKTYALNWMVQLPKILRFGNCSIQLPYKWPLPTHSMLHSLVQKTIVAVILRLEQVSLFWASTRNPSLQLGRMATLTQTSPATWTLGMMCIIVFACKSESISSIQQQLKEGLN